MGHRAKHRIVVVGDGADLIAETISKVVAGGSECVASAQGSHAGPALREVSPDLVLLIHPGEPDAAQRACRSLRTTSGVPIIAVTEEPSEALCIELLSAGADDCVARNCGAGELAARMASAIRRAAMGPYRMEGSAEPASGHPDGVLSMGDIRLDLTTCRITVAGVVKTLTPNEFRLMAVFLREADKVFTREDLRRRVWPDDKHSLHLVEVHIANLRAKIERDPHHPTRIVTVRSRGYKFVATL